MYFYSCKCGHEKHYCNGMMPHPCQVCPICGTTALRRKDGSFVPPEPHDWVTVYNEHTGKPYKRCRNCMETEGYEESKVREGAGQDA
jgi:hypothetical protein